MDRIPSKLVMGIGELLEAIEYAEDVCCDRWEFAVSLHQLQSLGCNEASLRWLVHKEVLEHALEVTGTSETGRVFCSQGSVTFSPRTCFVLTDDGAEKARQLFANRNETHSQVQKKRTTETRSHWLNGRSQKELTSMNVAEKGTEWESNGKPDGALPKWIHEERTLHLDQRVVKQYKWRAANQEAILSAFQEEGWPRRIDDPLPPQPDQDSKRRLSDTIKGLNRKQQNQLIRFHGDGTGEGIVWERIGCESPADDDAAV
ncbi:MAG: hypothetical protein AAGG48_17825 [Planctomycetota bacterium]